MDKKERESMNAMDYLYADYEQERNKKKREMRTAYISTLLWAIIVAVIIFFIDIRWLNYVAFAFWGLLAVTSIALKERGLFVFKVGLTVCLFVLYYFR